MTIKLDLTFFLLLLLSPLPPPKDIYIWLSVKGGVSCAQVVFHPSLLSLWIIACALNGFVKSWKAAISQLFPIFLSSSLLMGNHFLGLESPIHENKWHTLCSASSNPHLCFCWDAEYLCKVLKICIQWYVVICISNLFDAKMNHLLHSRSRQTKISDIYFLMEIKENIIQLSVFKHLLSIPQIASGPVLHKYQFIQNQYKMWWLV